MSTKQKKFISSSRNFVLLFLRQNQQKGESVKVKASLKGYTKDNKKTKVGEPFVRISIIILGE